MRARPWHGSGFRAIANMPQTMLCLEHLRDRFAGLVEQAAELYERDRTFRDLCEVHALCARGVKRSKALASSRLHAAYAAQQVRLEAELLRRLQTSRAGAAGVE